MEVSWKVISANIMEETTIRTTLISRSTLLKNISELEGQKEQLLVDVSDIDKLILEMQEKLKKFDTGGII